MVLLKLYALIISSLILSLFFTPIMSSEGIFEIHIKNYFLQTSLELDKCCPRSIEKSQKTCGSNCSIFMEICLSIYQKVPHRYACDIGENMIVTDVLGNDRMLSNGGRDYSIKVRERWSKNFNILVKIKHRDEETKKEEVIVTLSSAEENVRPSSDWITKQLSTPKDHFQLFVSFRYSCSEYHYGEMCDKYCKPSHNGMGHYNCSSSGDIVCHNGYVGSYCDKVVCKTKCIHGTCTGPNLCRCFTGWIGESCDKCLAYPGCVNGACRRDEKTNDLLPLTCHCEHGWGGMFCNIDLNYCSNNLNVCLNGGECQNFGNINTNQQYRCICKPGFQGTHCEKSVANCAVRGCLNEGVCESTDQRNVSACMCKTSFYGDRCQFNMTSCAENPCIGSNSKCYTDSKLGFRCDCATGFTGRNCEIDKDECSTNPCLNGGMCIDRASGFRCVCPVGFSGNRCQVNKNDCQRLSCMNGAKCMDKANRIDCECADGWTGSTCSQNIDECAINQPCLHNGVCEDIPGSYTCACIPPWTGQHCHLKVISKHSQTTDKRCLINPCRNNGVCFLFSKNQTSKVKESEKSIGGQYYCVCPPGFTGPFCNHVIITNDTITINNQHITSTHVISFTNKDNKTPITLINLIIISIGVPAILLILIVIICLWCKSSRSIIKSHTMKCPHTIIKGHNFANDADIKILNNKLSYTSRNLFSRPKLPSVGLKQNNCLNNIHLPLPHLSLTTYKCSMVPLVLDNLPQPTHGSGLARNPNLCPRDIGEEEDRFIDKSATSIFDRDGELESAIYQNVSLSKEYTKSSLESNIDKSDGHGYRVRLGSNSANVKRKKDRSVRHGLCSSQNSLLDSPRNENLRTALSQQIHQPSLQSYDDNGTGKPFKQVRPEPNHNQSIDLQWPLVNYNRSSETPTTTDSQRPIPDSRYVLYYTRSLLPSKINYNLISHPNFKETCCFRDSSIMYPSLKSVRTDSTSIDGNTSPNM